MYAKRNKRRIMRIFSVPPTEETLSEPNFYDTISKIRLRQQLEMYSISRKYDYQQPQNQADSVQLSLEWSLRKWATEVIVASSWFFLLIVNSFKNISVCIKLFYLWLFPNCFVHCFAFLNCISKSLLGKYKWLKGPWHREPAHIQDICNQRWWLDLAKTCDSFRIQSVRNKNTSWEAGILEFIPFTILKNKNATIGITSCSIVFCEW